MNDYEQDEWETMLFAPLWVFAAVAGADAEINKQELAALAEELHTAQQYKNELSREIFTELAEDFDDIMEAYQEDDTLIGDGLSEVNVLLEEYEDEEVILGFKSDIIIFAINVAKASRGWLFGKNITAEEKEVIDGIAEVLDLEDDIFYSILEEARME